jgi:hypothetical protein
MRKDMQFPTEVNTNNCTMYTTVYRKYYYLRSCMMFVKKLNSVAKSLAANLPEPAPSHPPTPPPLC